VERRIGLREGGDGFGVGVGGGWCLGIGGG